MTQNRKDRQVVWVSGASSGLGLAAAKAFHRAGYTVVSGARSFTGDRTGEGEEGFRICLDVSSDESVKGFAEEAVSLFGEPDILICCAGVLVLGPCETYSMQEISRVTDTDYYGQVRMIQAALPFMRRRRKGRILCFFCSFLCLFSFFSFDFCFQLCRNISGSFTVGIGFYTIY